MTISKEEAKEKIKEIIDNFKANYQIHKRELEANTETKLVEPLFEALGWTKKDFVKQEKAHRGTKTGHADYAFYIGDRIVFFLEVKKIGVHLEKEADKQVISYALSKRIPFASFGGTGAGGVIWSGLKLTSVATSATVEFVCEIAIAEIKRQAITSIPIRVNFFIDN